MSELIFCLLLILSQLSPGPDLAYVTRASLSLGWRAGVVASLGISTGLIVHAALVCGYGKILSHSSYTQLFGYLAGTWLLVLAYMIFPKKKTADFSFEAEQKHEAHPLKKSYREALLCNLLNPKCTIFLLSLSTPLLEAHGEVWYPWFLGSLIVITAGFGWSLWSLILQQPHIRHFYGTHTRILDMTFSIALGLFALKYLLAG